MRASDMLCSISFDRDDEFFATAGVSRRIKVRAALDTYVGELITPVMQEACSPLWEVRQQAVGIVATRPLILRQALQHRVDIPCRLHVLVPVRCPQSGVQSISWHVRMCRCMQPRMCWRRAQQSTAHGWRWQGAPS